MVSVVGMLTVKILNSFWRNTPFSGKKILNIITYACLFLFWFAVYGLLDAKNGFLWISLATLVLIFDGKFINSRNIPILVVFGIAVIGALFIGLISLFFSTAWI